MMHPFQLAVLAMAPTDWTSDESRQGRRVVTADERDPLADWGWRSPGLRGIKAACAKAVRWRWRPRASHRLEPRQLPASGATAPA
jgi:hypothetical protein